MSEATSTEPTRHPAKFSHNILIALGDLLNFYRPKRILDPFAGTGRVHWLRTADRFTVGIELEPEWASIEQNTLVGNAVSLPFAANTFDAVVTSPCYGNRMADHHNARDTSKRNTYKHTLNRDLHRDNAGAMQWGADYRSLHASAWAEANRVLVPGGLIFLNISNHIRGDVEQLVTEWHLTCLFGLGCKLLEFGRVETRRLRQGANSEVRVAYESIAVLRTKGPRR